VGWKEEWRLRPGQLLSEDEARSRLDYCLQGCLSFERGWRRRVWTPPAIDLFFPITRFAGKRVLELGMGAGRISCLLAAVGAEVTGVEIAHTEAARAEARRWGCQSRARFVATGGDYDRVPDGPYDVVVTKSMIGFSDLCRFDELLACIRDRLAPGGAGLFLENVNTPILHWVRRHLTYRDSQWNLHRFGLTRDQVARFADVFGTVDARRYYGLVWTIRVAGVAPS